MKFLRKVAFSIARQAFRSFRFFQANDERRVAPTRKNPKNLINPVTLSKLKKKSHKSQKNPKISKKPHESQKNPINLK